MSHPVGSRSAIVAIPAHNEAASITRCLSSVIEASADALHRGVLEDVCIVVVAHRCADDTYERARRLRAAHHERRPVVELLRLDDAADVGAVRALAVRTGCSGLADHAADRTWIFSTDADSVVGPDWLTLGLSEADCRSAHAVLGMVDLDGWRGSDTARRRYDRIITQGFILDEHGGPSHRHVYGANLMVRADAYAAVGGFPATGHGEDQRLVDALVEGGHPVLRSRRWRVTTSGRMVGRARGGLADLLHRLHDLPNDQGYDAPAAG